MITVCILRSNFVTGDSDISAEADCQLIDTFVYDQYGQYESKAYFRGLYPDNDKYRPKTDPAPDLAMNTLARLR